MIILITDVTEMHQGNYCVAGWDAAAGRMIRPLPNGTNWTEPLLSAYGVQPGATIGVIPTGGQPAGSYPHRTEDTPINPGAIAHLNPGPLPWFGAGAPPLAPSLAASFQQSVQTTGTWNGALKGAYVQEGTQIGSLAAVRIGHADLEFFEDTYNGKRSLRACMTDANATYNLPVVAKHLRELDRAGGVAALNQALPKAGNLHLRVGLARAWIGQPGKCTVMINGVYW